LSKQEKNKEIRTYLNAKSFLFLLKRGLIKWQRKKREDKLAFITFN
jgi:hypothetical protein